MPYLDATGRHFDRVAERYLKSQIHARGHSLDRLMALVALSGEEVCLDVGCGVGHTMVRVAEKARNTIGLDLAWRMLHTARFLASEACVDATSFVRADAHCLPFRASSIDLVVTRLAVHHIDTPSCFLKEAFRVLAPGRHLAVVDTVVSEEATVDRFINDFQRLRDPSHRRSMTEAEWRNLLLSCGYNIEHLEWVLDQPRDFGEWIEIADTPHDRVQTLRRMIEDADNEILSAINLSGRSTQQFTFQIPRILVLARKTDKSD